MSNPEHRLPEEAKLEGLLRKELLRRAKEIARTIEEQVRKLTDLKGSQAAKQKPFRSPEERRQRRPRAHSDRSEELA